MQSSHLLQQQHGGILMREKSKYTLQRTMIFYFLLIGFASCMVGIEFLVDFDKGHMETRISESAGQPMQDQNALFAPFDRMRKKALVMVAIILVVTLIVLTMFIKNISGPLQHMIDIAHKISTGDLSRTIKIQSDNELAELGDIINGMSSNLQEILLFSKGLCTNGQNLVDEAMRQLQNGPIDAHGQTRIGDIIQRLNDEFGSLKEIMVCFNFYTGDNKHHAG